MPKNSTHDLAIEYRPLDGLVPYARNARTHSEAQIAEIAGSIRAFGFVNPVLIAEDGTLIAGHGRVLAARLLGMDTVPAITLAGPSDTQRRALVLADNRIALNAGWDEALLALELSDLKEAGFDLGIMGFEDGDPPVAVIVNMAPVTRECFRVGLPLSGAWTEALNSDAAVYGGSGAGNGGKVMAEGQGWHGQPASASVTLPPLSTIILIPGGN